MSTAISPVRQASAPIQLNMRNPNRFVAWSIVLLLVGYAVAAVLGYPQLGRDMIVEGQSHAETTEEHAERGEHAPAEDAGHGDIHAPPLWMVTPFAVLLLSIAVMPLIPVTEHWWESNLHRFYVAAGLGLVTLLYYGFMHGSAVEGHWPAHYVSHFTDGAAIQWDAVWTVFANAMFAEYVPFIVLLFALFTISGGIRIEGDLRADPLTNGCFLAIGGALASFIGTTGAAMLLIRPLLETNCERKHVRHTVVFFIFVVCNCGGLLLPIGDPPLFLGYLRGVDFMWTFGLWPQWLMVNGLLVGMYLLLDHFYFYPRETKQDIRRDVTQTRRLRIRGLALNGPLLLGVVLAVALLDPSKTIPGTEWHPWLWLREIVQMGLVATSLLLGKPAVREANRFNYHAILEVAALFCGIFICMQPALQILHESGDQLGVTKPVEFFWITGGLSSVLDNAPTYVVFFETAKVETASSGAPAADLVAGIRPDLLVAISLGAVFMGAMTYIGNGPNFMVKAIAETSGVKMPNFFGYVGWSCAFLLPVLVLMNWQFLRG